MTKINDKVFKEIFQGAIDENGDLQTDRKYLSMDHFEKNKDELNQELMKEIKKKIREKVLMKSWWFFEFYRKK